MTEIIRKIGKGNEEKAKAEIIEILINSDLTYTEAILLLMEVKSEIEKNVSKKKLKSFYDTKQRRWW